MATPNMNLDLPVVSVTLGPLWAQELNAALEVIDSHDHSSGFGVPITPAGMDINVDLDFQNSNRAINLKSTQYNDQSATLTGATNASSVYSKDGDLYYTNGSGVAIQLTDGSNIISVPSSVDNFQFDTINTDLVIAAVDAYVVLDVDCGAARTITLPAASAVSPGRFYIIKDATGESEDNPMTIAADGSDLIDDASTITVDSNFAARMVTSNGVSKWSVL